MTNPRPKGGRPTALDQPYDERRTIAERIIELMATGAHVDTCAASVGIMRATLHDWLKIGARTRTAILTGKLGHPDDPDAEQPPPDEHSLRCMRFSDAVDAAQADWLLRQEALLETASRPSQRQITTRAVDQRGNVIRDETRTEQLAPDMATVRWRLERHPASRASYGNRSALEISGPDGEPIPVDVRVASITEKIAQLRARTNQPASPEENPDDAP